MRFAFDTDISSRWTAVDTKEREERGGEEMETVRTEGGRGGREEKE